MIWILARLVIRWLANSFGLWIAGQLVSDIQFNGGFGVIILAGLVLSIINALIKPIVVLISLPAIVFSLGLFLIIINGIMVYVASALVSSFEINSFGAAILAGIIIGLVNYAITAILEDRWERE